MDPDAQPSVDDWGQFAGITISSFSENERALADVLEVIPYCKEHEKVWSPRLATVLVEAGNQLNSLWKIETGFEESQKPDITDFHARLHESHGHLWAVFFAGEPADEIKPFEKWADSEEHESPDWWQAYNDLKHDRFRSMTRRATMRNAVDAMAGLFLALVKCEWCYGAISAANMVKVHGGPVEFEEYLKRDEWARGTVESRLYGYVPGFGHKRLSLEGFGDAFPLDEYDSVRFVRWYQHRFGVSRQQKEM